jgi:hypothetical protein
MLHTPYYTPSSYDVKIIVGWLTPLNVTAANYIDYYSIYYIDIVRKNIVLLPLPTLRGATGATSGVFLSGNYKRLIKNLAFVKTE